MGYRHYSVKPEDLTDEHLEKVKCFGCQGEESYFVWEDIQVIGTICGYKCKKCGREFQIHY